MKYVLIGLLVLSNLLGLCLSFQAPLPTSYPPARQILQPKVSHTVLDLFGDRSSTENGVIDRTDDSESFTINILYAKAWVGLVAFAFSPYAPGALNSPGDNALLEAIIANPVAPEINSLFFFIFNLFGPMPLILANLLLPQQQGKLPAGPFVLASSAIGYFALGPYMSLRREPTAPLAPSNGWFTKNVAESTLACGLVTVLCALVYTQLPIALGADGNVVQEFVDLLQSSRFCAVATIDLFLLYIVTTVSVAKDVTLRYTDSEEKAVPIALATAVVPYLGAAVYCTLRPKVVNAEEE